MPNRSYPVSRPPFPVGRLGLRVSQAVASTLGVGLRDMTDGFTGTIGIRGVLFLPQVEVPSVGEAEGVLRSDHAIITRPFVAEGEQRCGIYPLSFAPRPSLRSSHLMGGNGKQPIHPGRAANASDTTHDRSLLWGRRRSHAAGEGIVQRAGT